MKKLFSFLGAFMALYSFAQAPDLMSYQAVVWDTGNNLVTNTAVGLQFSILQGSMTGTAVYVETHTATTNDNGLVTAEIGNGSVVSGDFSTVDWGNGPYYLKSETDPNGGTSYSISGTTQLLTVPYAFYAETAENVINDMVDDDDADSTNEYNLSAALVGTDLNITDAGGTLSVDLSSLSGGGGTDDQTLTLAGTDLSIEDGNTVDLSVLQDGTDDADADPSNELQTISIVGDVLTLSGGGGSVTVPGGGDLDPDPTNEFQDLSFSADTVYISDGVEAYVGPEDPIAPVLIAPAANFGLPYSDVAYYKQNDRVYLQGATSPTSSPGEVLFALPVDYRPAKRVVFLTAVNGVQGRVDVYANGDVQYVSGPSPGSIALDGLSFRITN